MPSRDRPSALLVHSFARNICSLLGQSLRSGINQTNIYCCIHLTNIVDDYETYLAENMTSLINAVVEGDNASL